MCVCVIRNRCRRPLKKNTKQINILLLHEMNFVSELEIFISICFRAVQMELNKANTNSHVIEQ